MDPESTAWDIVFPDATISEEDQESMPLTETEETSDDTNAPVWYISHDGLLGEHDSTIVRRNKSEIKEII